jgi:hypothetical protein
MSKLGQRLIAAAKSAVGLAPKIAEHSGKCDLCDDQFIVWLDGRGLYCWKHYCEIMQRKDGTQEVEKQAATAEDQGAV